MVKAVRVLTYDGPEYWVKEQLDNRIAARMPWVIGEGELTETALTTGEPTLVEVDSVAHRDCGTHFAVTLVDGEAPKVGTIYMLVEVK